MRRLVRILAAIAIAYGIVLALTTVLAMTSFVSSGRVLLTEQFAFLAAGLALALFGGCAWLIVNLIDRIDSKP